jgi:hypothetical protein
MQYKPKQMYTSNQLKRNQLTGFWVAAKLFPGKQIML